MAIGVPGPFAGPISSGGGARPPVFTQGDATQPGTLAIVDQFLPSGSGFGAPQIPHGLVVGYTAQRQGFRGNIVQSELQSARTPEQMNLGLQRLTPGLAPDRYRQLLRQEMGMQTSGSLDNVTAHLDGLRSQGLKNSAVNLSQGGSPLMTAKMHYDGVAQAWSADPEMRAFGQGGLDNAARAFGLDAAKLTSSDPKVAGPERARLQQSLADMATEVNQSDPSVVAAKKKFDAAVHNLEANKNSVVVSTGNWGQDLAAMRKDAHGQAIKVPPGFTTNFLTNDETTNVGATRWFQGGQGLTQQVARYSNPAKVGIYASGSVGIHDPNKMEETGTSFAAPRVAAAMAALHKTHPDLSSAQVEALMKRKLTSQLPGYNGAPVQPVLDGEVTSEYLRTHRF